MRLIVGGPRSGVNHHACRLVDNSQVVVLVNDVERNLFGDSPQRRALEPNPAQLIRSPPRSFNEGFAGASFTRIFSARKQFLHAGAADVESGRKKLIDTLAGRVRAR